MEALHEHVKQFHSKSRAKTSATAIVDSSLLAVAHAKVRGRVVGEEAVQQLRYALEHYSRCACAANGRSAIDELHFIFCLFAPQAHGARCREELLRALRDC